MKEYAHYDVVSYLGSAIWRSQSRFKLMTANAVIVRHWGCNVITGNAVIGRLRVNKLQYTVKITFFFNRMVSHSNTVTAGSSLVSQ